jgi:hypothetical protein
MFRRRPELIVPIRDRRQRKRYLTLKNFGVATAAAVVLFIAITIRSEMRGTEPSSFGRLMTREMPAVEQKNVEVVREAPAITNEATHADPTLVGPMVREQWLRSDAAAPPVIVNVPPRTEAALASGETDVAIVGGPEGVAVVKQPRRRQTLGGGFGRQ